MKVLDRYNTEVALLILKSVQLLFSHPIKCRETGPKLSFESNFKNSTLEAQFHYDFILRVCISGYMDPWSVVSDVDHAGRMVESFRC